MTPNLDPDLVDRTAAPGAHGPAVRVVTDSASDLPSALAVELGVTVVPLTIRFGSEELADLEELSPEEFWRRLQTSDQLPATAAPSAGVFERRFRDLIDDGTRGIICICVSSKLSATMQSALVAAKAVTAQHGELHGEDPIRIEVVDSLSGSMGQGALCLAAARAAAAGGSLDSILADVHDRRDRTRLYASLDTLEYLKRGGRIGSAAALVGSVLSIRPLIEIREGVVEAAGKVRTRSRALRWLADKVAAQPVESLSVLQGEAEDLEELMALLTPLVPRDRIVVGTVGPVVGTHAGPGVIGVTFQIAAERGRELERPSGRGSGIPARSERDRDDEPPDSVSR